MPFQQSLQQKRVIESVEESTPISWLFPVPSGEVEAIEIVEETPARAPAWTIWAIASLAMFAVWLSVILVSQHVVVDKTLQSVAIFVHLVSLVVGFGAVLTLDYYGFTWILGRRSLGDVIRVSEVTHWLIWGGLGGLLASGMLLKPDPTVPVTFVKLVLVLVVGLNGLNATVVNRNLQNYDDRTLPNWLMRRSFITVMVSQVGWWGAMVIGFMNTMKRSGR